MALLEGTRFLSDMGVPLSDVQVANLRMLLVGLALIVLLRVRPQGLLPHRRTLPKPLRNEVRMLSGTPPHRDALAQGVKP